MKIIHLDCDGNEFDINSFTLPDDVWELVEPMWESEEVENDTIQKINAAS